MKKTVQFLGLAFMSCFFLSPSLAQNVQRDTTLFKEHQVVFEKMDFIPSESPVQISRKYQNDSTVLSFNSDPYWISSLVSNKEYQEYLETIKNDVAYPMALPEEDILSQTIEALHVTLKEYTSNTQYEHFPVLGLSWNQAKNFCVWKTKQVNKELDKANLPHEKSYRIPLQTEIEGAKKFTDINQTRIFKCDSTYQNPELLKFCSSVNELTDEAFIESIYLKGLPGKTDTEQMIVYSKNGFLPFPFQQKDAADMNTSFRYVQTYRKVPNSE